MDKKHFMYRVGKKNVNLWKARELWYTLKGTGQRMKGNILNFLVHATFEAFLFGQQLLLYRLQWSR